MKKINQVVIGVLLSCAFASAHANEWLLLTHSGCVSTDLLRQLKELPRAPTSPEDYVKIQRDLGQKTSIARSQGFAGHLFDKIVRVTIEGEDEDEAIVFVSRATCERWRDQ